MKRYIAGPTACLALLLAPAAADAATALPLSIPFEFANNQVFLKTAVNGQPPAWFILDSGASGCVIDAATAKRWKLKVEGQASGTGAGKGTVSVRFANDVSYALPGANFTAPRSYVIDLANQKTLLGRPVAGILGYDFFARYVVALDFEAQVMTLHDPATYAYTGAGTLLPIRMNKRTPHVRISVKVPGADPVEHEVLVDLGSGDGVDDDALATSPQRLEIVGGVGLGQEFRTVLGRAEWARIGPYLLEQPTGVTGGVQLIGNETLRRFNVVFDYAHARMALEPNTHLRDAFGFDASGLSLRWTEDLKRFVIHDVAAGSPAAEAGLKTGEIITAIDGQPAGAFSIDLVQKLLSQPGRGVRLDVGGREVALTLRARL